MNLIKGEGLVFWKVMPSRQAKKLIFYILIEDTRVSPFYLKIIEKSEVMCYILSVSSWAISLMLGGTSDK